ncbi:MAG: hypothetical protein M1833_000417 [Piccolia ochrophora]|nr:MAG: hypothetical protein M1833_000417 [Piccolia ochrophora]
MSAPSGIQTHNTPHASRSSAATATMPRSFAQDRLGAGGFDSQRLEEDSGSTVHQGRESLSHTDRDREASAGALSRGTKSWRHRQRNSGGFLLDSALDNDGRRPLAQPSRDGDGDGDFDVFAKHNKVSKTSEPLKKERSSRRRHKPKQPSLGSSPLALQVTNAAQTGDGYRESFIDSTQQSASNVQDHDPQYSSPRVFDNHSDDNDGSLSSEANVGRTRRKEHVGLDTDPAQIVSLALGLSESRRRSANLSDAFGLDNGVPHRSASGATSRSPQVILEGHRSLASASGSLTHLSRQKRYASRTPSPIHNAVSHGSGAASPHIALVKPPRSHIGAASQQAAEAETVPLYRFSSSTIARAEKAKLSLELAAEHRRLLQYLPPLRVTSSGPASPLSTPSSPTTGGHEASLSQIPSRSSKDTLNKRPYNPLQSIRNRKVRAREKIPIDPDAQGWSERPNVTMWVDQVEIEASQQPTWGPHVASLPPLWKEVEDDSIESTETAVKDRQKTSVPTKQKRPRSDWSITPSELLADTYWVEQLDHKLMIEDRHGNRIFSDALLEDIESHAKSREYRNMRLSRRLNGTVTSGSRDVDRVDIEAGKYPQNDAASLRGRRLQKMQAESRRQEGSGASRLRKYRWRKGVQEVVSSSGSETSEENTFRGRKRPIPGQEDSSEKLDSAVLEKQMMAMLEKEAQENDKNHTSDQESAMADPIKQNREPPERHKRRPSEAIGVRSSSAASDSVRQRRHSSLRPVGRSEPTSNRASTSLDREKPNRVSLEGLDTTAPNSPRGFEIRRHSFAPADFVPSIATDLSNPTSREVSPNRSAFRRLEQRLGFQKTDRNAEQARLSEDNLTAVDDEQGEGLRRVHTDQSRFADAELPQMFSPLKRLLPTRTNQSLESDRLSTRWTSDDKGEKAQESSRIRGIFKGGRLEELVRGEVSKFGDLLWKRDAAASHANVVSSRSSALSDTSESEEAAYPTTNESGEGLRGVGAESAHTGGELVNATSSSKYHMDNLPSFVSTADRDEHFHTPNASPEGDPIARQQSARKAQGQSSRFQQLAPPKIDMTRVSPASSPNLSRDNRRGSDASFTNTNWPSDRVQRADSRLNSVLGIPGRVGRTGRPSDIPTTGLTGLSAAEPHHASAEGAPRKRSEQWSISKLSVPPTGDVVTRRDIARVTALFYSTGIKARQIYQRAKQDQQMPSSLVSMIDEPVSPVPRGEQHMVAARILITRIESTRKELDDATTTFSQSTLQDLRNAVEGLEQRLSSKLTPSARSASDAADSFNFELSTKRTLDIKNLRDNLDALTRRRRRRFRWVRRSAFVLLEWLLLGLMWCVWFIVVIVRFTHGTVQGVLKAVKWLLWL